MITPKVRASRWPLSAGERFDKKVRKSRSANGCHVWIGSANKTGYGRFWNGERLVLATHFSYERAVGPVPAGLFVLHRCDNPPCVRPEHLFIGTKIDNHLDMMSKGRGPDYARGEASNNARLTDEEVRQIRASPGPLRLLAERFGVSITQLSRIRRGLSWRHLCD